MDILEFVRESLKEPEDFVYFGDLDEELWGRTITHHRDSSILSESNWNTITEDMLERFPDDCEIESANHFAVGWLEVLRVKVLTQLPLDEANVTDAAKAIHEWHERLEEYPVANDEDFSEREHEDLLETLENCYGVASEDSSYVAAELENVSRGDDIRDDESLRYAKIVGKRKRRLENP